MKDHHFRLADLSEENYALEEIRSLEKKLSEQHGSEVVLIAYAADSQKSD